MKYNEAIDTLNQLETIIHSQDSEAINGNQNKGPKRVLINFEYSSDEKQRKRQKYCDTEELIA